MINNFRFLAIWLLLTLIIGCQSTSYEKTTIKTELKSTLEQTIDNYLTTNISPLEAGAIVLLIKEGEWLYKGSSGMAQIANNMEITELTGFRIASISKTFTAIAVMQLYEQGLLSLEDSILDYFPNLSKSWEPITIHHLLSHQSGIFDFGNDSIVKDVMPSTLTNNAVLSYFETHPQLEFPPGSKTEYSNSGYVYLAAIIEKISGQHFGTYLEDNIFHPLYMINSYVLSETTSVRQPFALNYGKTVTVNGNNVFPYGPASIVSTIDDMASFTQAIIDNKLVSAETFDLMRYPYGVDNSSGISVNGISLGYGLVVDPNGKDSFFHNGGLDGYRSMMFINRESQSQIIILGNGGSNIDHFQLLELISEFMTENNISNE